MVRLLALWVGVAIALRSVGMGATHGAERPVRVFLLAGQSNMEGQSVADLAGRRIATSYAGILASYLDRHGVTATVVRLDRRQASAALGTAGANLAAISAASGAHLRLVDGGAPTGAAVNGNADDVVGLELSGAASAVDAARGMVSAFVLAGGARPLST